MAVHKLALFGLVATCLVANILGVSIPKFTAIPESFKKNYKVVPAVEITAPMKPKAWYASWPTSMRLTILGNVIVENFQLYCFTENLDKKSELSEINFCFNKKCEKIKSSGERDLSINGYRVTLSFSKTNGGSVNYGPATTTTQDMTTEFYCSVKNSMGTVRSNTLKIMDLRRRFPKTTWLVKNEPPSSLPKNAPRIFKCFNNAVAPSKGQPPYFINWSFCSKAGVTEPRECTKVSLMNTVNSIVWAVNIRANGDLFIPYFPDEAVNKLNDRMLVCMLNQIPVAYYQKTLTFNNDKSSLEIKSLKMVRPVNTEKVTVFNSEMTSVYFPCNFEIGPGDYSVNWKFTPKDGGSPTVISTTRNEQGVSISNSFQPNALHFKGPFSDKTVGTYTCDVTWTPMSGGTNQKGTGSYDLEVQFFPTVSKDMVPLKYVADGEDGVVKCLFNGLQVKPSLSINGQSIDLKSKQAVDDSIQTVNSEYTKVMSGLRVKVAPINPKPGTVITYTAIKMTYRSEFNKLPSTHTVECIGTNEVGSVRTNTLLKVVPKPVLVAGKAPSSLNCSECSAAEAHTIRCEVSNVAEITKNGAVFNQFWKLGNRPVKELLAVPDTPAQKYLVLSDDGSLTIKKIDDEGFKKKVNEHRDIECVLTLGYPASAKLPVGVKKTGVEKGLFFISSHSDMKKELTTPIKLTNIAPPTLKTGSMMWVIPVILALIVILIIIGATYYCCRQRTSGEEYNVDAKEKQQGNDPEVEVAEKEAFPVFERPEDGPIRGSRASLDDSIHVGSDDEDEVLAEYDVDIGKFDEEGSFIGQYAVNDGNATGNRRLPQVGNNTEV